MRLSDEIDCLWQIEETPQDTTGNVGEHFPFVLVCYRNDCVPMRFGYRTMYEAQLALEQKFLDAKTNRREWILA